MEQNTTEHTIPFIRSVQKGIPVLLVFAVLIALTLSGGLVLDFDEDIGHFAFGSPAFYLMAAGVAASAVFAAVLGKRAREKFSFTAYPDAIPFSICASYFTAFMAIITTAASLYDTAVLMRPASTLELFAVLLLPALPISMILGAHEKTRSSVVRILFALLAALAVNLNMFACYFDFTLPLNSAVRNLITITQAGVMLFLLSEVRLALSPETRATAPFFVFTSAFAASAVLGISFGLCVFAFVSPNAAEMDISVYRFACYFGVGLLALSRLFALNHAAGTYSPPAADEEDAPPSDAV